MLVWSNDKAPEVVLFRWSGFIISRKNAETLFCKILHQPNHLL